MRLHSIINADVTAAGVGSGHLLADGSELEAAGQKELAAALISSFGGLHAAAWICRARPGQLDLAACFAHAGTFCQHCQRGC